MPTSAGPYLRNQREAVGFSREHVAMQLDSDPAVSCRARAELLGQIEDGLVPVSCSAAVAIWRVLRAQGSHIDLETLAELVDRDRSLTPPIMRRAGRADLTARHDRGGEAAA